MKKIYQNTEKKEYVTPVVKEYKMMTSKGYCDLDLQSGGGSAKEGKSFFESFEEDDE